jgi:hypothetical protein
MLQALKSIVAKWQKRANNKLSVFAAAQNGSLHGLAALMGGRVRCGAPFEEFPLLPSSSREIASSSSGEARMPTGKNGLLTDRSMKMGDRTIICREVSGASTNDRLLFYGVNLSAGGGALPALC